MDSLNTASLPAGTTVNSLADLVTQKLSLRWDQFAQAHPNLAQVIDRTRLVETVVASLRDDPQFTAAIKQADLDETQLVAVAQILTLIEQGISRLLPLI